MSSSGTLGLGVVGLGYAGREMAAAAARHPRVELRAVADRDGALAQRAASERGIASYDSVAALVNAAGVDAVYIATPTPWHHEHALAAANAGRHAIVEKPMAATLDDADEMVRAFRRAGRTLVVGHSHSFDVAPRQLAALVRGNSLGPLQMMSTWCFTDWVRRPRKPEDLDGAQGGGVTYRQGAHQFDIVRLVTGVAALRVRASGLPISGGSALSAYSALVEFEGGLSVTAIYSGLGHFDSRLLTFGVGEVGERIPPAESGYRRLLPATVAPASPLFGLTIAGMAEADVIMGPEGLLVERGDHTEELPYGPGLSGWDAVLDEFCHAVLDGQPPTHDGRWGVATLELCAAVETSARTGQDVVLERQ